MSSAGSDRHLLDGEALEWTVGEIVVNRFAAFNAAQPPGVVNQRTETITWNQQNKSQHLWMRDSRSKWLVNSFRFAHYWPFAFALQKSWHWRKRFHFKRLQNIDKTVEQRLRLECIPYAGKKLATVRTEIKTEIQTKYYTERQFVQSVCNFVSNDLLNSVPNGRLFFLRCHKMNHTIIVPYMFENKNIAKSANGTSTPQINFLDSNVFVTTLQP